MLKRFLLTICLSLAVFAANAKSVAQEKDTQQNLSVTDEPAKLQADVGGIPISSKEVQLAFFAGLTALFIIMVSLLFRKYRSRRSRKDVANDGFSMSDTATFTPTFFSSESSPAILVAEHNNDLRLFITNTLRLNYRVISAADGHEACEKAIEIVPDLIITDRLMPGMDGPMLCRKLKSTEATSHIPIIILTAQEKDLMTSDWHQYADDHLHASFDARELLMRVHNLIAQRKSHQEEYRRQIRAYPDPATVNLPEYSFLLKVLTVLETEYGDPMFGVDHLTGKVSMSKLQLYRKLKALTTYAPGEFIRQYRLEQAKQILLKDQTSVTEVAGKTGFSNLSSFTKAFKDYTGKTPVEFVETERTSDESLVGE
jgi:CheY-like chemotaxis protein